MAYTVTFDTGGGSSVAPLTEQTNLPSPLPTTTKTNHVFAGWYYDNLFAQKATAGDELTANVTLYAKWYTPTTWCEDIADAIREKEGSSGNIRHVDFPDRIEALPSPKEEQTKTVSPTTSSQDVLPDANKVLSKVTVSAIPTETKSQQPNLSSGNETINATSGKFMTSFTITKDTINHIASNIRSGKTLYGVAGSLQPAKEEETKTITPNFSSGNVVVTPTSGKVMTQVTVNKDTTNHKAENIKKDVTLYGVTGTYEGSGGNSFLEDYPILVSILVSGEQDGEIGPTKIEAYINENLVHTSNEINEPMEACCHFSTPSLYLTNATFKIRLYHSGSAPYLATIEAYYLQADSKSTTATYGALTKTTGSGYVDYTKVMNFRPYPSAIIVYLGLGD